MVNALFPPSIQRTLNGAAAGRYRWPVDSVPSPRCVAQCTAVLAQQGVIAYPTEAVWGYGCNPFSAAAVARLLMLKQRDWRKGLILVAANEDQLLPLLSPLSPGQRATLRASWPGPNTWVIPDPGRWLPRWVTGEHDSVAVRVSAHPVVRALCAAWGGPLISTSANRSGHPPARTELALRLDERADPRGLQADFIVPGATLGLAKPTAIRDLMSQRIVRQG